MMPVRKYRKHLPWLLLLLAAPLQASYLTRPEVRTFIDEVSSRHGLERAWIESVLAEAQPRESIIAAMTRPAEKVLTWAEYRKLFLNDKRIRWGHEFLREQATTLARAESTYGVPAHVITAIIGVETYYGRYLGSHRVLDALANLGFDYPPRATFFRSELEQFLLMTHEQGLSPAALRGSYAGAMGLGQFIPSSYRRYAVDFNGDGVIDLWNVEDAIGSVARYFALHGWQTGQPVTYRMEAAAEADALLAGSPRPTLTVAEIQAAGYGIQAPVETDWPAAVIRLANGEADHEYWLGLQNFYVITRYNHSPMYAMAVYQLSQVLQQQAEVAQR